jgi:syntaxin 1B/2/3
MGDREDLTESFRKESQKIVPPPPPPVPEGKGKKKKKGSDKMKDLERGELYTEEEKRMKMDEFYTAIPEIKKKLDLIGKLRETIEKTHKESLGSKSIQDSISCSNKINSLMSEVHSASQFVRKTLKDMQTETERLKKDPDPVSSFIQMRDHQHKNLIRNYLHEMEKFQKMQEKCSNQYKDQIERQYKIVNPKATREQVKAVLQDPDAQKSIFATAALGEAKEELKIMEKRCSDMKELEQSIIELAALFAQLKEMLFSQRDVMNKVGANIRETEEYAGKARKETEKAAEEARAYRKKKLIIIGIIAFIILAALIYATLHLALAVRPQPVKIM